MSCDEGTIMQPVVSSKEPSRFEKFGAYRIVLLVALSFVLLVAVRWHNYQWDFYLAYDSGRDLLHGVNPYRGAGLSFYQAPLTLYLYSLPSHLPFFVAYELWLAVKVCALGGLLWIWDRHFMRIERTWWMVTYFLLAYAGALYADLVSGNISIFEQFGLWLGFAALLRNQYARFCVCIILVSQFKLTPMLFSLLLLAVPKVPQWKWFAVSWAGFLAVFSLNSILQPTLLKAFFHAAPTLDERGTENPSTLAFLRDLLDHLGIHDAAGTHVDELAFVVVALVISAVSVLAILRCRRSGADAHAKVIIYLTCVAYCLLVPRLKSYSYVLLLIPTLHLLRTLPRRVLVPAAMAGLAAMVVFPHGNSLLPFHALEDLFYEYLPLAAAFGVWIGYLFVYGRGRDWSLEPRWVSRVFGDTRERGSSAAKPDGVADRDGALAPPQRA
jgi:Glycosyltransferase family 87